MNAGGHFISELVRAANEVDKLSTIEKCRLLERAVTTIRDMREQMGIAGSRMEADPVIDLQTIAVMSVTGQATDEQIRFALLDAAGMIRTLKIMLDAKDEILKGE